MAWPAPSLGWPLEASGDARPRGMTVSDPRGSQTKSGLQLVRSAKRGVREDSPYCSRSVTESHAERMTGFHADALTPSGETSERLWRTFAHLERREWGKQAFPPTYFRKRLRRRDAVIVVLSARDGDIAGFITAIPDASAPGALYVEDTLVDVPYRGRGLVALMSRALEDEGRRRGYRYLTRDAAIRNGYADKLERAYAGRVLERFDHPSPYGPQRYLKLAL